MKSYFKNILPVFLFLILGGAFIYFAFIPSLSKINTDFPNYYVSSNMYLDGTDLKTAYNNVEFNRQLLLYGINGQIVSFVPYPPLTALLMLPVAKLSPLDAKLAWNIFNLVLLFGCIFILSKIAGINFFSCGVIFFMSGFALANNFIFGQVYLLVLLFLLLFMYFMKLGRDIPAALFLSLSIVLKFYTVFFIFLLLFKKRFKLLLYTVIFSVVIYIPAVLLTGFELNLFYFTEIMPRLGEGWVGTVYAAEYQSFTSLLHRWFSYEPMFNPKPLVQSIFAFLLLKYIFFFFLLALSVSVIKSASKDLLPALSLFCIVSLLLLPVNASYQFVVLIPAIAILFKYYSDKKKYIPAALTVFLMFLMNSHIQVFITNFFKNTPLYILAYVKLIGLIILFAVNVTILLKLNSESLFNKRSYRLFAIGGISAVILTALSFTLNKPFNDEAEYINTGNNYLISMPSAYGNKLVWTECINEKFVIRSNFGYSYDRENVFYPVLNDSEHIIFETIKNRTGVRKIIDIKTGIQRDASGIKLNAHSFNSDRSIECYSADGVIIINDHAAGKQYPLTSGKQFCYFPVFANDSTVVFISDRNRGVGFTALYKMNIKHMK